MYCDLSSACDVHFHSEISSCGTTMSSFLWHCRSNTVRHPCLWHRWCKTVWYPCLWHRGCNSVWCPCSWHGGCSTVWHPYLWHGGCNTVWCAYSGRRLVFGAMGSAVLANLSIPFIHCVIPASAFA